MGRQNGRLLGMSAFARLLVIVFVLPRALQGATALLLTRRGIAEAVAADEDQPLLTGPAPRPSSKYAHAEPWVSLVSFALSMLGWLSVALAAVLASEKLLVAAVLVLALGIGGNATLQAYAVNLLEAGHTCSHRRRDSADQAGSAGDTEGKRHARATLDMYLGILGMLENIMSVLAPLLDGAIYAATLSSARYTVFVWAALQYALCTVLLLWL